MESTPLTSNQLQKRTHSESSAKDVTAVAFESTPPRKQGGRRSIQYSDDDNDNMQRQP